jgi:hypothetical protein
MIRQPTNSALQSARDSQRRATLPYQTSSGKVQDMYPAYDGFPWSKIEAYLKSKWPYWTDFKQTYVSIEFEVKRGSQ